MLQCFSGNFNFDQSLRCSSVLVDELAHNSAKLGYRMFLVHYGSFLRLFRNATSLNRAFRLLTYGCTFGKDPQIQWNAIQGCGYDIKTWGLVILKIPI